MGGGQKNGKNRKTRQSQILEIKDTKQVKGLTLDGFVGVGLLNANGIVGLNGSFKVSEILDVLKEKIDVLGICESKETERR